MLKNAREQYEKIVLENEISTIENYINSIGTVTLDSRKSIEYARSAYNKASQNVKSGVSNLTILEDAETELTKLLIGELEAVIDSIGIVTLDSQQNISDARNAYNNADTKIKENIRNLAVLENAEAELSALRIVETERLIDEIGEITSESLEKYQTAKEMYNNLSETEKKRVSNANILSASEVKIAELELFSAISQQEVRVISTKYVVQDNRYKALYPDMLRAIIQNNSQHDIKNAKVAFVAWDKNNLPVKIIGIYDYNGGSYIKLCNYSDINLVPGAQYGNNSGMPIDDDTADIKTFKAIVVSYETFDGETWENPLFDDWCALYEGIKLNEG